MDASSFLSLALACAPAIHIDTARALIDVESSFNPWAIGVVGGTLERQPRHRREALATARALQTAGWNFSVGLGQVNVGNLKRLGLTLDQAFAPCTNLAAMQTVLSECYERARAAGHSDGQVALHHALSCYYSGNFTTGFEHGYVRKLVAAAARMRPPAQPKEKP